MDVHFCTPPGPIAWGMNPPMRRLSSTVMRGNRRRFSGTCTMPSSTMRWRRGDEVDAFHLHAAAHRADQSGDDAHQDVLPAPLGPITGPPRRRSRVPASGSSLRSARTCPTTCRTGSEYGQPQRTTTTASNWCRSADPAAPSCMRQKWRSATRPTRVSRLPPYDGRCADPLAALKLTGVIGFPSPGRGNQTFSSLTDGGTVASSTSTLRVLY